MIALVMFGILVGSMASLPMEKADHVLVLKGERKLNLLSQAKVIRTYKVALGGSPVGAKEQQGDHKTPEGNYVLDKRNPKSQVDEFKLFSR